MHWRRASIIQDGRAFTSACDATVLKHFFFRDNFVSFRCRSKRIAFLESVNFSTCDYMQLFNFRDRHQTTFWHPSCVFRTTIVCAKFYPDRLWMGSTRAKNLFWVKTERPSLCLAVKSAINEILQIVKTKTLNYLTIRWRRSHESIVKDSCQWERRKILRF